MPVYRSEILDWNNEKIKVTPGCLNSDLIWVLLCYSLRSRNAKSNQTWTWKSWVPNVIVIDRLAVRYRKRQMITYWNSRGMEKSDRLFQTNLHSLTCIEKMAAGGVCQREVEMLHARIWSSGGRFSLRLSQRWTQCYSTGIASVVARRSCHNQNSLGFPLSPRAKWTQYSGPPKLLFTVYGKLHTHISGLREKFWTFYDPPSSLWERSHVNILCWRYQVSLLGLLLWESLHVFPFIDLLKILYQSRTN